MEINTVMKETIYSILQEPTREKFVEYLLNGKRSIVGIPTSNSRS